MNFHRSKLAVSLCRIGVGLWSCGAPGNQLLCRIMGVRHVNIVHEMFLENGLLKIDKGVTSQPMQWTGNPGQREFEKLVQMFSELENRKNISTLFHFDTHVNHWAKTSKSPEFAEKWLNYRLQKPVTKAIKVSLILGYLNSFTELKPSTDYENRILKYMNEIENDLKYVDTKTFAMVIAPLCMTRQYKECLEMVRCFNKNIENVQGMTPICVALHLHHFVNAALTYGHTQFAKELISQYCDHMNTPHLEKLWTCLLHHSDTLSVHSTLQLMSVIQHLYPSHHLITKLEQAFKQQGKLQKIRRSKLTRHQTCQNCGTAIESSHFGQDNLQRMQASIHGTLSKHHAESFETFLQFLQNNRDFQYVVDGMWILHKVTGGNASTSDEKRQAGKQIKDFLMHELPGKKLIIGRNFMFQMTGDILQHPSIRGFPVSYSRNEKMKAAFSMDDLFVLYAALQCQPDCYIVSGDFMRDHSQKVDFNLQIFYTSWISTRTIVPLLSGGKMKCKLPFTPKPVTNSGREWHILTSALAPKLQHQGNSKQTLWCIQA